MDNLNGTSKICAVVPFVDVRQWRDSHCMLYHYYQGFVLKVRAGGYALRLNVQLFKLDQLVLEVLNQTGIEDIYRRPAASNLFRTVQLLIWFDIFNKRPLKLGRGQLTGFPFPLDHRFGVTS